MFDFLFRLVGNLFFNREKSNPSDLVADDHPRSDLVLEKS